MNTLITGNSHSDLSRQDSLKTHQSSSVVGDKTGIKKGTYILSRLARVCI